MCAMCMTIFLDDASGSVEARGGTMNVRLIGRRDW